MWKSLLVFIFAFCMGWAGTQFSSSDGMVSPEAAVQNVKLEEELSSSRNFYSPTMPLAENPTRDSQGFRAAGLDSDQEAKVFYLRFQRAVAENDKRVVAGMVSYPLNVYFSGNANQKRYTEIMDRKAFIKNYDRLFSEKLRSFIASIDVNSVDDLWGNYHGIAVGRGVIWIGVYCRGSECKKGNDIKIRTIHGNSAFVD